MARHKISVLPKRDCEVRPAEKRMRLPVSVALVGISMGILPAQAQPNPTLAPSSKERLTQTTPGTHHPRYVEPTGRRKPPGVPLDDREGLTPRLEHHDKALKEHTLKSICRGSSDCKGGHRRPQL